MLEATADLPIRKEIVETPLEKTEATKLGCGLAVVPILRAGLSMLESALELFPDVAVGYVGLERSHETAVASSYYSKLPPLAGRRVLCVDPMLATGGSASQAIALLKQHGATDVSLVCVVAAPEGVERMIQDHPEVPIFVAALDRELNGSKYILPGLGDYGDRLYGTH
jgi:uracil phosphoribosyltransferase